MKSSPAAWHAYETRCIRAGTCKRDEMQTRRGVAEMRWLQTPQSSLNRTPPVSSSEITESARQSARDH
eukprot:887941-Rhodomonas_salina.1